MSQSLVIVESPAKAKTIKKYLGRNFEVLASYGHVRDLIPKEGAVDTANGFAMKYAVIDRNEKHVQAIAKALKKSDNLYLATDPDREGEAISWHLVELLKERGLLKNKQAFRVVFHEITKAAVKEAIDNPGQLSGELINAQQARRALDYLVGFNLSPLLWKKIRRGLSAGRVQSPALRLICEREKEIDAFIPREYWSVEGDVAKNDQKFVTRLIQYQGEKVQQFSFTSEDAAFAVEKALTEEAGGKLKVVKIDRKKRRRSPAAPYTTSTLQQDASRKLGFTAQRTMRTAQKLYEGINVGDGEEGLITYMRTDSVTLSKEAIDEIRHVVDDKYGADHVPAEPNIYKTKAKNAQEAHEAVRITSAARTPEQIRKYLDADQFKLYDLIWKRTVASQMVPAVFNTVAADMAPGSDGTSTSRLRANGSVLVKPGFLRVYQGSKGFTADEDKILPEFTEGDVIDLLAIRPEQHFTEPPPRFSEASLVKTLEEHGIGRPSTYASIISTLQKREYVEMDKRRFIPTEVGKIVNTFLTEHFTRYVDYDFTARLEDDLDAVSRGEMDWVPLLDGFWKPFDELVQDKEVSVSRDEAVQARILGTDPKSGKPVSVRMGRFGPFVQIGTRDDEDKPKFAGLREGLKMDSVSLEEALALFKLPRKLGETPDGEPVSTSIGPFGPYVKYGTKFVSIRKPKDDEGPADDPYSITLERALELVEAKKIEDANRLIREWPDEGEHGIQILNGRYGPYIT
ncbi:MAG: type I DNA topoisomerase, partial [Gammaproteobacteria bacterium]|nr:type I DNA topoisomerase [Gammaproteobacteria bacterium]